MFDIGESLIYGASGICQLEDILERDINQETRRCYVLRPVYEAGSTLYVPVGSEKLEAKMRPLLCREEVYALIDEMPQEDADWIENENQRRESYTQALASGDRTQLVQLIKTVFARQQELRAAGRKLRMSDERFMKDAERALYDEFAYVLGMAREEVFPFICQRLGQELPMAAGDSKAG